MDAILNRRFETLDEALAALENVAREQGFATAIRTKRPSAANPTYVLLRCSKGSKWIDQGDPNIPESKRRRNTISQMTACPFKILIKRKDVPRDSGNIFWSISVTHHQHNHEMIPAIGHTKYRVQIVNKYKHVIISLYNSGNKPSQIMRKLHAYAEGTLVTTLPGALPPQDPDVMAISRSDISNVIMRYRNEMLNRDGSVMGIAGSMASIDGSAGSVDGHHSSNALAQDGTLSNPASPLTMLRNSLLEAILCTNTLRGKIVSGDYTTESMLVELDKIGGILSRLSG
ncbi:hypothetical protein CDD82_4888 [Ophiocordyceps australis]|uniref:FAR1 domain-containing protein n=1 Tax=Ophiocordyceps australis TaxID=1399860 RepID=A0A2C5Z3I3_9HYPO|nr:hypothetical protein CDD82_4888 [Ophiocordyceps australis]